MPFSGMHRLVPYIAVLLFIAAPAVRPQGENGNGHGEQPQPPTKEQIAAEIKKIKTAPEPRSIVEALGGKGKDAREALFGLLDDEKVTLPVLRAVTGWMRAETTADNVTSNAALDALCSNLLRWKGDRRATVHEALEWLDYKHHIFAPMLSRLRKGPAAATTPALIHGLEVLAKDRDEERCQIVDVLIELMESGSENGIDAAIRSSLERQTLHTLADGKAWRAWYVAFLKKHDPSEFTYLNLQRDRDAAVHSEATAYLLEAIQRFVTHGVSPWEYLDTRYRDPVVRRSAAEAMSRVDVLQLAGTDAAKRMGAVKPLLEAAGTDPDVGVQGAALKSLGAVAAKLVKGDEAIRGAISNVLMSKIDAKADLLVLQPAVEGLTWCPVATTGNDLGQLYIKLTSRDNTSETRRAVIATLAAIKAADHIVAQALQDKDVRVRETAASSIGILRKTEHAEALAKAWKKSDPPSLRRDVILNLEVLGNYAPDAVMATLSQAATDGKEERVAAMRALIQSFRAKTALASKGPALDAARKLLIGAYPGKLDEAGRTRLIAKLGDPDVPALGALAIQWCAAEQDASLRKTLCAAIVRKQATLPLDGLEGLAVQLVGAKSWAEAELLLDSLIERASAGQAPESESDRLLSLRRALAKVLIGTNRRKDADELLSKEIDRVKDQASGDLFEQRARVRKTLGNRKGARADFKAALRKGGTTLASDRRKALLIEVARLELALDSPENALDCAIKARPLAGPPSESEITLITVRAGLRLPRNLAALERAVSDYERLEKQSPKTIPLDLKKLANTARTIRDLIRTFDTATDQTRPNITATIKTHAPPEVAPWLLQNLAQATAPITHHRLTLLKQLFPKAPFTAPPLNAPPPALNKVPTSALTWWTTRP